MKIKNWIYNRTFIHSLRMQLMIFYMAVSLLVLSTGAYFSYTHILGIVRGQNEKYLLEQLHQTAHNLKSIVNEMDRLSRLFIQDNDVQQFLITNSQSNEYEPVVNQQSILKRISNFISSYTFIDSIYIYTESGGLLGGSESNVSVQRDREQNEAFYSSEMYRESKRVFPVPVLAGGNKAIDFNQNLTGATTNLISLVRSVKPIADTRRSSTLVFNIDERYFASVYSGADPQEGNIYVVDDQGSIISSGSGEQLGSKSSYYDAFKKDLNFGSYVTNNGNGSVQVVYYQLSGTNWHILRETPLEKVSAEVLSMQRVIFIVFMISLILIFLLSYYWLGKQTEPLRRLAKIMRDMSSGKLGMTIDKVPNNEFGLVIKRFNEMSLSIVDLIDKNERSQEEKRRLEIESLQAQINPHFIYNTLNMIKWMAAVSKAKNIMDSVVALGNIIRPVFKNTEPMCRLDEEIGYLENYMKIMNWRFGNRIKLEIIVPEELHLCTIPRFILQPIIENSVVHGMKNTGNEIMISLTVSAEQMNLHIEIKDNGSGIVSGKHKELEEMLTLSAESISNIQPIGIGLYNVQRRIRLNFGDGYGLGIESQAGTGTTATIIMPINY